jgi:proteasome lid subunit RPN8/RPN11
MSSLSVSRAVDRLIRDHAARAYPDECCGVLLGSPALGIIEALPAENSAPGDLDRRFLLSAGEFRDAETRAAAAGLSLLGIYHSHPDAAPVPSAVDLEHAWPNLSYFIVSVTSGRADEIRSWRLADDRSRFIEEALRDAPETHSCRHVS